MPVNSVSENKKGVEKPKISLSLNRKKTSFLSNENRGPCENSKENTEHSRPCASNNKENRPAKRPLNGIYLNTVSAAKRLKPLTEVAKLSDWQVERELVVLDPKPLPAMLNGHHTSPADSQYGSTASVVPRKTPIATLCNLGNTCFLNSVLYTLRNGIGRQPSLDGDSSKATLGNIRKSWKKRRELKDKRSSPTEDRVPSPQPEKDERSKPGYCATMIVRTMCMECETVTEKAQAVCGLCVPVGDDDDGEPFRAACLSTEYLRDANKVLCYNDSPYNVYGM
ncbi:putative ubiquitin specific protease [Operophtera brumata]|uniref:Putative ubiquitin specific protease n=1 Tax=Operophtera brumata TaxID=104452 RepID=A0A0L7KWK1_OPEBR|nr:putative ubiquitin specific protease [Operophtera brumata]